MWERHQVSQYEAIEAASDPDAILFDPDPKGRSGGSARLIGYSPSAGSVLVLILVLKEEDPRRWWGATGWRANLKDRERYEREAKNDR